MNEHVGREFSGERKRERERERKEREELWEGYFQH